MWYKLYLENSFTFDDRLSLKRKETAKTFYKGSARLLFTLTKLSIGAVFSSGLVAQHG